MAPSHQGTSLGFWSGTERGLGLSHLTCHPATPPTEASSLLHGDYNIYDKSTSMMALTTTARPIWRPLCRLPGVVTDGVSSHVIYLLRGLQPSGRGYPAQVPNQLCRPREDPEPCLSTGGSSLDLGPRLTEEVGGGLGDRRSSPWLDHHDSLRLLSSLLRNGGANPRG